MRAVIVQAIMKGDEINVRRIIADDIKRIANERKKAFSFGHRGLINALCEAPKVGRMGHDLKLKKGCVLDSKWLAKASEVPIKASARPNGKRARFEEEEPRVANVRYNYLTLRLSNTMVDLSTSLRVPCVQFEASKDLQATLKKVRVEPKKIFECCEGDRWVLNTFKSKRKLILKLSKRV